MQNKDNVVEFRPDQDAQEMFSQFHTQMVNAQVQAGAPFAQQMLTIMQLEIKRAKLPGEWRLEEVKGKEGQLDHVKFVRVDVPGPPQADFTKKSTARKTK